MDDQDLVDTLEKSKVMSEEVQKRVEQSEETQKEIDLARKKYLPVSITIIIMGFEALDGE